MSYDNFCRLVLLDVVGTAVKFIVSELLKSASPQSVIEMVGFIFAAYELNGSGFFQV